MRVLVTGAGGQVGQAVVALAPPQATVHACVRSELDITDERSVMSCISENRPDVIVNAAAYTAVDRAESEVEIASKINAYGPHHLAVAARETGAYLIHISTDFVFDGNSSTPYHPTSPTNPLNVYGITKRVGEEAVLQELPERSIVLRTSWVYAANGRNFMRTMLRAMADGKSVRVVADQVGTPTSAESLARVIWALIKNAQINGVHHWTDTGVASWYDFAVAIAEEATDIGLLSSDVDVTPISTSQYPTAARRPPYSVLDTSSLLSLGIFPTYWRTSLRRVLGEIKDA